MTSARHRGIKSNKLIYQYNRFTLIRSLYLWLVSEVVLSSSLPLLSLPLLLLADFLQEYKRIYNIHVGAATHGLISH